MPCLAAVGRGDNALRVRERPSTTRELQQFASFATRSVRGWAGADALAADVFGLRARVRRLADVGS